MGPLVLAAVALTPEQSDQLIAAGLRDSKPLSPRHRTALAAIIRASASWVATEASSARVVDRYVAGGLEGLPLSTCSNSEWRRAWFARRPLAPGSSPTARSSSGRSRITSPNLRAVNHADDTEPSVMAAAIVAKVERDRL